jgi:hypothetical protein
MTPLEKFGSCLLDEPAQSDRLNGKLMKVLRVLRAHGDCLRQSPTGNWLDWQEAVVRSDLIFFDFLRTPIKQGGKVIAVSEKVEEALPIVPTDERLQRLSPVPRAPLNGFVLEFLKLVTDEDIFMLNDFPHGLADDAVRFSDGVIATLSMYDHLLSRFDTVLKVTESGEEAGYWSSIRAL